MAITMTTTIPTSNMRNSSRQTRTNPARTSRTVGTSMRQNSLISNPPAPPAIANEPAGFYPAITHFTDAITALPRDYRRHASLLKEVDAKAWHPEENLQKLLRACLAAQPTREETQNAPSTAGDIHTGVDGPSQSAATSVLDNTSAPSLQSADAGGSERSQLFASLRQNLLIMMITMDEKNHVINNANEEISRHLRRLQGSYPAIAEEVSEEARLGSLKHWAYFETNPLRRTGNNADRRQAAAGLAVLRDANEVAQRSEARRQALKENKTAKNPQLDSDFDEPQVPAKKAQLNGRNRRVGELAAEDAGLGISGAGTGKRKKTEKNAANGAVMERSTSATGGRAMSKEPLQQDGKKRKNAPTSNPTGPRKRLNAQDSPKLASSPLAGVFGKDVHKRSPAPAFTRPVSSRARQNSTQNAESFQARPSSSTSRKNTASVNGVTAGTSDLNSVAAMTGKSAAEVKQTMKESTNQKGERLIEEDGQDASGLSMRGGILLQRSSSKQGLKREVSASDENGGKASPRIPPPLDTAALKNDRNNRSRPSKTSTPVVGLFAESPEPQDGAENGNSKPKRMSRPRMKDHGLHDSLSPKALPPKRSHKKGAGLLAQQQFQQRQAQLAADDAANSSIADGLDDMDDDEEANGEGADEDERYCYCNDVSYGEMVACDNKNCAREWFHLRCVGLEKAPGKNAKWFCDECKELMKKGRLVSVSGNGNR